MRWLAAMTAGAAALLLGACGGTATLGGGEQALDALAGQWRLVDGDGPDGDIPTIEGHDVLLDISPERWGGRAHCNSYSGTVEIDGDTLGVRDVAVTEMACLDQRAMAAEAAYIAAFLAVTAYDRADETLELTGEGVRLAYERVPPVEDAALVGTRWVLESLVSGAGPDGAVSSVQGDGELRLHADGSLTGSTGCNQLEGDVEVEDDTLLLGPLATTRRACPDLLGPQETHVLTVLQGRVAYEIDGASLSLSAADGSGLHYRAAAPAGAG